MKSTQAVGPENAETIKRLKDAGLQVKISHRRPVRVIAPDGLFTRAALDDLREQPIEAEFAKRGGRTVVSLLDEDGHMVAMGEARCRPDESFNRRLGLTAALGRAVKNMNAARADGETPEEQEGDSHGPFPGIDVDTIEPAGLVYDNESDSTASPPDVH